MERRPRLRGALGVEHLVGFVPPTDLQPEQEV